MRDEEAIHSNRVRKTFTSGNMENQHLPGRLGEKEMSFQGSIKTTVSVGEIHAVRDGWSVREQTNSYKDW